MRWFLHQDDTYKMIFTLTNLGNFYEPKRIARYVRNRFKWEWLKWDLPKHIWAVLALAVLMQSNVDVKITGIARNYVTINQFLGLKNLCIINFHLITSVEKYT